MPFVITPNEEQNILDRMSAEMKKHVERGGLLTEKEVSQLLAIPRWRVRWLRTSGRIRYFDIETRIRFKIGMIIEDLK